MFELMFFCLGLFIGYVIGELITVNRARIIFNELRRKGVKIEDLVVEKPLTVYQLQVEDVNGVLYLYERQKNEFICQGKNIDELADLALKYKNITYAAVLHNQKIYSFVNGKIKTQL